MDEYTININTYGKYQYYKAYRRNKYGVSCIFIDDVYVASKATTLFQKVLIALYIGCRPSKIHSSEVEGMMYLRQRIEEYKAGIKEQEEAKERAEAAKEAVNEIYSRIGTV